ncbi:MAG: SAM-dependent methyltransferase [Planctomycetes bacterium]|nr:SAM-dependent methyltransferase [Planctomycetota bacterium]
MATRDSIRFIAAAMRNPTKVGAIAPSSAVLGRAMVAGLSLGPDQAIVEMGPGTGPITQQIRTVLPHPGAYLGIEYDPVFVQLLRERFTDLRFVEGSAEHALKHLADAGHDPKRIGAIISGLPFASLPAAVAEAVVAALDELMEPGVVFRTFQYVHAWPLPSAVRFRRRMEKLFGPCRVTGPVVRNVPPAFVLSWSR